ncbi:SbcC/MukB-like Walker B domain-containing protein [Cupriavidus sp. CV2]|uniref:ATP-binding protein n=1 Tax=Cupriavidus ulmosensis TaxID=3065913 RepID=UPI00296B492B|nr:SbcC/MukB-like Walker B domain-containing protein [Cupriavidus sp. CV2]MDW3687972.1 SbcC/MukB-like Walker B domain-containing protein [Cupriavidus sp. CV2]
MKLEKLILVNWGFVVSREYPFGDTTLLSGSTGVGKSSFQDAIQLVMTGGKQHINVFNSAQDESGASRAGGKVRRTLASYAVGMRDNLCVRPYGSHTYIVAVFAPDAGESAEPFTAVVAVEAAVSGTREQGRSVDVARKLYFVLPGSRAMEADFIESRKGNSITAVKVEDIYHRLRQRYPRVLPFENSIEDYLCKLYAEFRGGGKTLVGPREAEAAARAFVQSIARKTVGSVDELIREQVLAEPDFSDQIGHIASLMQNVQRLRKIATELLACRERLGVLKAHADAFLAAFEEAMEAELGESLRRQQDVEEEILRLEACRHLALADVEKQQALADRHAQALKRATELHGTAKGRLNGNPVAQDRERLSREIAAATEGRSRIALDVLAALTGLRGVLDELAALAKQPAGPASAYAPHVERLVVDAAAIDAADGQAAARELAAMLTGAQIDPASLRRDRFARLDAALAPIAQQLHGADGLYGAVVQEQARESDRAAALQGEINDLKRRRQGLEDGHFDLPAHVEAAVRYLEAQMPGARPRVLCNLVQPREGSRWQNAIEGLLGGNRFVILVDARYEASAIRALRHELPATKQGREASVVQGELAKRRAENQALSPDAVLQELVIADETARAYLVASYGRYVKVADAQALRGAPQALTVDGMASGGFKMFSSWVEDGELAFGAEARRKRVVRLARQIDEKTRERDAHRASAAELTAWGARLLGLKLVPVAPMLDKLGETQRGMSSLAAQLASLDDSDLIVLERRVARAEQLLDGHHRLSNTASRSAGEAAGRARGFETNIADAEAKLVGCQDSVRQGNARVAELIRLNPHFDPVRLHQRAREAAKEQTSASFDGRRRQQAGLYRQEREAFERKLEAHNLLSSSFDERVDFQPCQSTQGEYEWQAYGGVPAARRQISAMLERLDQVRILNNTSELRRAEKSFNNTFSTHFALAVRTAVEQGIDPLKRLNEKLKRLAFGEDRFEIEYGQMVKEYKKYFDLFQDLNRLAETQTPVDLFSAAEGVLSADSVVALDDIKLLLLDTNRDHALRRLKDIADYRNYRQYDIRKHSEDGREASLARMATFSGGELMTPAYLVRAAVLAQAFRQFEKTPSLKLMMIDEAFDKMDEGRTAAVMRYLNENLGLQLVVAMPSRASGPLLELFSFEHRFSLMKVEGLAGELDKITEVDSSLLKADRLHALWTERRATVRREAISQFDLQEARKQLVSDMGT